MNYNETLEYIEQSKKYGSVLGLNNIHELLKRLGNPQEELNVVHVAGTNGKGSVIAFLSSVLQRAGYKTGVYVSPAVDEYNEIIRVNDEKISESDIAGHFTKIREVSDEMSIKSSESKKEYSHPTLYEMETAMAFMHFAKMKCDIVFIETGMGGREDATNVMEHVVCSVLTSISLDHMQFLGDTVRKIAECKAGIIKKGCPVVLGVQDEEFAPDVIDVVKNVAKSRKSKLIITDNSCDNPYDLGVLGTFQQYNAAEAVKVIGVLREAGYNISEDDVVEGLKNARWPGRFEMICDNPKIIIDGAHNPGAAKTLATSIEMYFTNEPIIFIMGVLADKDYRKVIGLTAHLADKIFTITPDNTRALDGALLAEAVKPYNANVEFVPDMELAVKKAVSALTDLSADCNIAHNIDKSGAIIVFGSLSFLGQIRKITSSLKL